MTLCYHFTLALNANLHSSCSSKHLLDFYWMPLNTKHEHEFAGHFTEWLLDEHVSNLIKQKRLKNNSVQLQPSSTEGCFSGDSLFLCWTVKRLGVNDYWLACRKVWVRGPLPASLVEWLLLARLFMLCRIQVSGCLCEMLFTSPAHYLWRAGWPLALMANMQRDAYQFKLRESLLKDEGM